MTDDDGATRLVCEHGALFGLYDELEVQRHIEAGVLVRIERVCDLLHGLATESGAGTMEGWSAGGVDEGDGGGGESGESSSDEEEEEADEWAARLRDEAHARREQRRARWVAAGERLASDGFAIIDGFMGEEAIDALRSSVNALHGAEPSQFVLGRTGGGKDGKSAQKFAQNVVRGDQIAVLGEGEEGRVPGLSALLRQADELVKEMARGPVPALRTVTSRSRPMLACYPGNGARYVCHLDNPGGEARNGRLLTLLAYLNKDWRDEDGGVLRLHRPDRPATGPVDVAPLADRCVVFWSDARTPHEVLPAHKARWAISAWYHHDDDVKDAATTAGDATDDDGEDGVKPGGVSQVSSFGQTTEEIESFLLALAEMKGGDAAHGPAQPKSKVYQENLRSW